MSTHLFLLMMLLLIARDACATGCLVDPDGSGHVAIPTDWNSIPQEAFQACANLTSVTIPKNIETIGERAFHGCTALTILTFADSDTSLLTTIGKGAFFTTRITSLVIPPSVVTIDSQAFYVCTSLTNLAFGSSSTTALSHLAIIGEDAFYKAPITSVTFPASLAAIGVSAFRGCASLDSIAFACGSGGDAYDHYLYISNNAFDETPANSASGGVTSICRDIVSDSTCSDVDSEGNLRIHSGQEYILESAFESCQSLVSLTLPVTVKALGSNSFRNCENLQKVIFDDDDDDDDHHTDDHTGPLFNGPPKVPVIYYIGTSALQATALTELDLPISVSHIASLALADNTALMHVFFKAVCVCDIGNAAPGCNVTIEENAFQDTPVLIEIYIPQNSVDPTDVGTEVYLATDTIRGNVCNSPRQAPAGTIEIGIKDGTYAAALGGLITLLVLGWVYIYMDCRDRKHEREKATAELDRKSGQSAGGDAGNPGGNPLHL